MGHVPTLWSHLPGHSVTQHAHLLVIWTAQIILAVMHGLLPPGCSHMGPQAEMVLSNTLSQSIISLSTSSTHHKSASTWRPDHSISCDNLGCRLGTCPELKLAAPPCPKICCAGSITPSQGTTWSVLIPTGTFLHTEPWLPVRFPWIFQHHFFHLIKIWIPGGQPWLDPMFDCCLYVKKFLPFDILRAICCQAYQAFVYTPVY